MFARRSATPFLARWRESASLALCAGPAVLALEAAFRRPSLAAAMGCVARDSGRAPGIGAGRIMLPLRLAFVEGIAARGLGPPSASLLIAAGTAPLGGIGLSEIGLLDHGMDTPHRLVSACGVARGGGGSKRAPLIGGRSGSFSC